MCKKITTSLWFTKSIYIEPSTPEPTGRIIEDFTKRKKPPPTPKISDVKDDKYIVYIILQIIIDDKSRKFYICRTILIKCISFYERQDFVNLVLDPIRMTKNRRPTNKINSKNKKSQKQIHTINTNKNI